MTNDPIDEQIISLVQFAPRRLTPPDLEVQVQRNTGLSRRQARGRIKKLIQSGWLVYTYQMGCTFLVRSLYRPIQLSERIYVSNSQTVEKPSGNAVLIRVPDGDAFGEGRHPSTRLALQGIDAACRLLAQRAVKSPATMLDVGTGTGILIIAALQLGIHEGLGIDTDANARFEAVHNVRLNGLQDRIDISAEPVAALRGQFDLVAANLRMPSLTELATVFAGLVRPQGWLVLSGVLNHEQDPLTKVYQRHGFRPYQCLMENGWAGLIFQRRGS